MLMYALTFLPHANMDIYTRELGVQCQVTTLGDAIGIAVEHTLAEVPRMVRKFIPPAPTGDASQGRVGGSTPPWRQLAPRQWAPSHQSCTKLGLGCGADSTAAEGAMRVRPACG